MLTPRRSRRSSSFSRRDGNPHRRNPHASSSPLNSSVAAAEAAGRPSALSAFNAVDSSLAQLKANVYESIYIHYKNFHVANQYDLDLRDDVGSLDERLVALAEFEEFSEKGAASVSKDVAYARVKIAGMQATLSVLDNITKLHHQLQGFDNLMETGEFTVAAVSVEEMNDLLQTVNAHKGVCEPEIMAILRDQCVKKRAAIKYRLQELTVSAVIFSTAGNVREMTVMFTITATAFKQYLGNPILLEDIFTAFDTLGELEDKLKPFVSQAVEHILLPLLRHGDLAEMTTSWTKLHAKCRVALSARSGVPCQKPQETGQVLNEVEAFRRTLELSKFICSTMFSSGGGKVAEVGNEFAVTFGRAWWPAAWAVLKAEVLDHQGRGSNPTLSLEAAERSLVAGREFEREMISIGMMPSGSDDVSLFLGSRALRFTQRRRAELLSMARDILTSADENTVEVTDATERGGLNIVKEEKGGIGTDSFSSGKGGKPGVEGKEGIEDGANEDGIRLPTCHITVQTQTLVEMAYQTLMEISGSDEHNAIELFYCARDLFDLFRALVPVHRAQELENSLTASVLFYNDCTYIVHHLLTMGYQFKSRLLPPLNQTATMVDMIPAFRKLGQGCFRTQMIRQRDLLLDALRSADGFGNTDSDERFDKVERAIKRCTYQLTQISNKWKVILPTELYLKSFGILLGTALETVIREIFKLEYIPAEETHQLRYLCGMFSNKASTGAWFCISRLGPGLGGMAVAKRKIVEKFPIANYCPAWAKFEACGGLLEVDAEEFAERRRAGALKEHFLDAELDRLFEALHPNEAKMKF